MTARLQLPVATRHTRTVIDNCEWRIHRFVKYDAHVPYDYWITTRNLSPDVVTRDHLFAINNAMPARAKVEPWSPFLGTPIPELRAISPELDLISSSDREVDEGLLALRAVCQRITSIPHITDMAFSKVFYLLRRKFIPISDSYVRLCLGVPESEPAAGADQGSFYAARLERVARALRDFGRANAEPLERLIVFANTLPPIVPRNDPFRGERIPVRLTSLRVLDILLWSEVAVYGRSPHPVWLAAHREAFGEPTAEQGRAGRDPRKALPAVPGVDVFRDDDEGYLDWLEHNQVGLVVNCERSPRSACLILHSATCRTIGGTPARGTVWTGPYIKACAVSRDALAEWAMLATNGVLQACRLCRP